MNIAPTDIRLLFMIEAIHRLGSLTAAANSLNLTQPALSHALGRMRLVFGDPLFVRTPRGMHATPKGDAVAASARRIVATIRNELGTTMPLAPAEIERQFTFSMSDVGEMVFLPSLLERLRVVSPRCDLRTVTMAPERLAESLDDGTVDLAVGHFPELRGTRLEHELLFERGYLCLCASDHPRIRGKRLSIARYLKEPHLVVEPAGRVEQRFEAFLRDLGHTRRVLLSVPHMFCVPSVVSRSDLIVTVPWSVAQGLATYPGLRVLNPPIATPAIQVTQVWGRRYTEDPVNRWLRGLVSELFAGT